ncbi:MAG: hypothetical protein ISR58_13185 [Anaerolineales bacterium]|nr:hypothetical protein [Candidatus Brocadiales bacterium]MBL6982130.1 hypothetical protein [Anaerolineales bacterium]
MALLAEEIVEEWLNRNGFFTIRGIKLGVHEIDLLAIGFNDGKILCRHVEVQASIRPVSYICPLPKNIQNATGRSANSAKKRSSAEISKGVEEWIDKKYQHPRKIKLREGLLRDKWKFEFVVHKVKSEEELKSIEEQGIEIHRLDDIIAELSSSKTIVSKASGSDLVELVLLGKTENK